MSANNFILRCEVKPSNRRTAFKFRVDMNQVDEARRKWFKLKKGGKRVRSALNFWWKVSDIVLNKKYIRLKVTYKSGKIIYQ